MAHAAITQGDLGSQPSGGTVVQRRASGKPARAADVHARAAGGVAAAASELPHARRIQTLFGRHDVSKVRANVGGAAASAAADIGASAYAMGSRVAFARAPDLHTAAHEAAHVVQQRAGVSLPGGVGSAGDVFERHADRVADAVVQGRTAEGLLDDMSGGGAAGASSHVGVQRRHVDEQTPSYLDRVHPAGKFNRSLALQPQPMSAAEWAELAQALGFGNGETNSYGAVLQMAVSTYRDNRFVKQNKLVTAELSRVLAAAQSPIKTFGSKITPALTAAMKLGTSVKNLDQFLKFLGRLGSVTAGLGAFLGLFAVKQTYDLYQQADANERRFGPYLTATGRKCMGLVQGPNAASLVRESVKRAMLGQDPAFTANFVAGKPTKPKNPTTYATAIRGYVSQLKAWATYSGYKCEYLAQGIQQVIDIGLNIASLFPPAALYAGVASIVSWLLAKWQLTAGIGEAWRNYLLEPANMGEAVKRLIGV